jgi:uncharacterized integral membrane protein
MLGLAPRNWQAVANLGHRSSAMNQPSEYRSSEPPQKAETPWRLIVFAVIAVVTVVFILQNRERREIDFLFFEVRTRVWVGLFIAVLLGVILDRLFQSWWRRRRAAKDG